eukprot:985918_1
MGGKCIVGSIAAVLLCALGVIIVFWATAQAPVTIAILPTGIEVPDHFCTLSEVEIKTLAVTKVTFKRTDSSVDITCPQSACPILDNQVAFDKKDGILISRKVTIKGKIWGFLPRTWTYH